MSNSQTLGPSGGTAGIYSLGDVDIEPLDINPPDNTSGNNMWTGSYILAKVEHGLPQLLTPDKYTALVNAGYDVQIVKSNQGT